MFGLQEGIPPLQATEEFERLPMQMRTRSPLIFEFMGDPRSGPSCR